MQNSTPQEIPQGTVAVLIPHYNDLAGLDKALASLAAEDVAVIVIDNGSSTAPRKEKLIESHPRLKSIELIQLAENISFARALNVGLSYAGSYDYIARLDCGDVSLPGRIAGQRAYLDAQPSCHLVGSWAEYVDDATGTRFVRQYPCRHPDIVSAMYRGNVFCPSATMYRRASALDQGGYSSQYQAAEDYALCFNLAVNYQVANIPQVYARCELPQKKLPGYTEKSRHAASVRILASHIRPGFIAPALRGIAVNLARLILGEKDTALIAQSISRHETFTVEQQHYSEQTQ